MATTVTYKGATLTTANNQTKTLKTAGKYMEDDVTITDVSEGGSAIVVTEELDATGGTNYIITAVDLSDDTVSPATLLSGYTAHNSSGQAITGTYTGGTVNNQNKTVTPTTSQQTITADSGYTGLGTVTVNRIPTNYIVPSGTKSITANGTGIDVTQYAAVDVAVSSSAPSLQSKTKSYTPSETAQNETISPDSGYDGLSSVAVSVGAISSTYVGSGIARKSSADLVVSESTITTPIGYYSSAASKSIAAGSVSYPTATKGTVSDHAISVTPAVSFSAGYISGGTKNGTAVTVSASELVSGTYTVNGSGTVNITNYASLSVPAGTAGTPSGTKGTVSNHSITVTPTVTNTTGYITGSTKNGTAVTVSASELVSGTSSVSANGTFDVTNYASVNVAIPIVTYYTGSSTPASSLGSNGDLYLKV